MPASRWFSILLFVAMPAAAQQLPLPPVAQLPPPVERPRQGNFVGEPGISPQLMTEAFLAAHPDLRWRREGLHAYANGHYDQAYRHFLRAARYADKPAQAMLAEMHWKGIGVPQDREIGYAWMDLAAERLYSAFVVLREAYWQQLDPGQRTQAIERGQALLAEYGDVAAKPRMVKVLRRHSGVTGGRVGFVGNLEIIPLTGPNATGIPGGGLRIRGDDYYAPKYWQPERYFEWQDEAWDAIPRTGRVEVGDLERADAPTADDEP